MIRVATVHWQDERWIEPQLRYLDKHAQEHRVYASINGIDPAWGKRFHFAADVEGSHSEKLNALAEIVRDDARPDDLLLFLDGDAFPIAPLDATCLGGTPLTAVRRDENVGDRQPHPCFCLTTVGFWFEIAGDWRRGHRWTTDTGDEVTDVGGNLLGILESAGIAWHPLLRSNRIDLDPLWFGIYGDLAYHHGAGFRPPLARRAELPGLDAVRGATAGAVIPAWVPVLGRAERSARYRLARRRHRREVARSVDEGRRLSDEVFGWIQTDDEFFRRFLGWIALLLVTQDEGELLRANIRHHLEWGVDHVGVADNDSTDATAEIARDFGDAVSYRRFSDFHERQAVRTLMLDQLRARCPVSWVGIADTDEFYWAEGCDGVGALLADTPDDVVGVNFDMKLFLPTDADVLGEPVFMSRSHRTSSSASPLHTSYRAGKSFYRADWLTTITDEHWCPEVPHPLFRHDEPAVHHYMVQDEDQFVQKVTRLIAWAPPPEGRLARFRWRRTPAIERPLPGWSAPFKKDWWAVYQRGGEAAVREHYRNVYTLAGDRRREALADGSLVEDPGFARWSRSRYGVAR